MDRLQATKAVLGAGVLAAALYIVSPFIATHEGDKLDSYEDMAGVWTVCEGVTGPNVTPGIKMTAAQCDGLNKSEIGGFMTKVANRLNVTVSPETLAAHTSFAYNIGIAGYSRSKTLLLTNQGKLTKGCLAMANWETAGGLDCTVKSNGCYGLVMRRNDEINLCLVGIQKGK